MNSNTSDCVIESTLFPNSRFSFLNKLYWVWYCKLKRYVVPAIAVLLSLFAMLIIVAELAIFIPFMKIFNVFGKLTEIKSYFALNCLLLVVFAYIVFCVYYALFKLKFASFYGLYWNKQTDASSLMFYAMYVFVLLEETARECQLRWDTTSCRSSTIRTPRLSASWGRPTWFPFSDKPTT